jgi:hypothetical protein
MKKQNNNSHTDLRLLILHAILSVLLYPLTLELIKSLYLLQRISESLLHNIDNRFNDKKKMRLRSLSLALQEHR